MPATSPSALDLAYPAETEPFRNEVRDWVRTELDRLHTDADDLPGRWQQLLYQTGWACPTWPVEYGGRGLSTLEAAIAAEEFASAGAPLTRASGGELLLGPTLLDHGTPEQQARFLPPIARGEEVWCQGFSEPGAGSDLASLSTRAERDGDEWVFHGRKIWTSEAEAADLMFLLAVTAPEAKRHKRFSYFLLPMQQPGVQVIPIAQPDGRAGFNEVVLDGARCPATHLVGVEGEGWGVAMGTLRVERGVSAFANHHRFQSELESVITAARDRGRLDDPDIRDRIVRAWCDVQVLRLNYHRLLTAAVHGPVDPGVDVVAATHKFYYTEFHQRLSELALDVLGPEGQVLDGSMDDPPVPGVGMGHRPPVHDYPLGPEQAVYLFAKAGTIYGGTSQIQRTVVAERVLGMPRGAR